MTVRLTSNCKPLWDCHRSRLALSVCQLIGQPAGVSQTSGECETFPGDVERRPVIDRGADDRQPERDIDPTFEIEQLHRNVSLVMIHTDHRIVAAFERLHKNGVRRKWPVHVNPGLSELGDGWENLFLVFNAERSALTSVRIESGHGDAARGPEPGQHAMRQFGDFEDVLLLYTFNGLTVRNVGRG